MALLYADEHIPPNIVKYLRLLGHDVRLVRSLSSNKQGDGISDSEVLQRVAGKRAAVLTKNVIDFKTLHSQSNRHFGIIACSFNDFGAPKKIAKAIDLKIREARQLQCKFIRVTYVGP